MKPEILSLISGFVGAIIGAAASIITVWIQARIQSRKDLLVAAATVALEDFKSAVNLVNEGHSKGIDVTVAPSAAYVIHHARLMESLLRGRLNSAELVRLLRENQEVLRLMKENPPR